MQFQQLSIHPAILRALAQENYVEPTPIQTKAIPPALSGRDLLGCAQTGTGKTAAFAVPILQRLGARPLPMQARRPVRALILTPTRELALQIYESFLAYGRYTGLRAAVVFGGVAQGPQEQSLRRGETSWWPRRAGSTTLSARGWRILAAWRSSPWTKPTACWIWASSMT